MIVHPIARMIIGLSVGFTGAVASVAGVEWLGSGVDALADGAALIDQSHFRDFCTSRALGLVQVGDDPWRCGGFVNGLWTSRAVTAGDVCAETYGLTAAVATSAGGPPQWRCTNP